MKTFIRWQGNKSKHINKFIKYIPEDYNTYIEPFVGSGAMFLKLQPTKWIINDINKDLINIWKFIKNNPNELIDNFNNFGKEFKKKTKINKVSYCRELTNKIDDMSYDINRASVYMLMKYCVYMGNIIINNKFYFKGLDLNISINNDYPFLKKDNYDNIKTVSEFLNNSSYGKIYNKD